ncbi:MAG TPA: nuclear transport factor 2 family protein [Burkholderiales bacterium]|nr:nuclear transport factor 2 family protein [Burkholderiales bacterium]
MNKSSFTGLVITMVLAVAPVIAIADDAADVEKMEQKRMEAVINADMTALNAIYADDFFYNTSSGSRLTKSEYLPRYASGELKVHSADSEARDIRVYGNTALVTGIVHVNLTTKGENKLLHLRYLNVWVKRANGWVLVARQGTNLPAQ